MIQELLGLALDVALGASALAQVRAAKALATAAQSAAQKALDTNSQQDTRLDKLVSVAENHETRLTILEVVTGQRVVFKTDPKP